MGLVSVVKVAEAYVRHGGELWVMSRAIRVIARGLLVTEWSGDSGSGCRERRREPMGHCDAMRGWWRVSCGCGWVSLLGLWEEAGVGERAAEGCE